VTAVSTLMYGPDAIVSQFRPSIIVRSHVRTANYALLLALISLCTYSLAFQLVTRSSQIAASWQAEHQMHMDIPAPHIAGP